MNDLHRTRRRGVTLTAQGLAKLEEAKFRVEAAQNIRLTLEKLSELSQLSPDTIMRLLSGTERVDRHTVRRYFQAFQLNLEPDDFFQPGKPPSHSPLTQPQPPVAGRQTIELPSGQVAIDSPFYLDRPPIETKCHQTIQEPGALIRIKAPKQTGKTSLMAKVLAQAREQKYATVTLSLVLAESSIFNSLDRFLQWFCACISQSLELPNRLEESWDEIYGSSYNVISYFEKHLLPALESPLILALDDIDCIFQHPKIAIDFLGLLRAMYEKAKYGDASSENWQKLRIMVIHSTEVYIPLNNNRSPFNVGLSIELPEFTTDQVLELAHRHQLDWDESTALQLTTHVGGHPLLIRQALYYIAHQEASLHQVLGISNFTESVYGDHLRRLLIHLQQHPNLMSAFGQVVKSSSAVQLDPIQGFLLHSLGLVHLQDTMAVPSCQLYQQYFRDRL
jgi:transcriptional regulator with XRE-family HTH domain